MVIKLKVVGIPVPKGRPRFARRGKFVTTRTPAKTRSWEELVRHQTYNQVPDPIPVGALGCEMTFRLPRPQSLPKKVKSHIKKPDVENLAKSVMDALEGLYYKNDSQVTSLLVFKEYTTGTPGVDITLTYYKEI